MIFLDEYLAARELAIEIAGLSESSGREIEEIFATVLQRCGSPELGGLAEEIVAAAHAVRTRVVELRRDFLKIADKKGDRTIRSTNGCGRRLRCCAIAS